MGAEQKLINQAGLEARRDAGKRPDVTVVVSLREQFSVARRSLESLYDDISTPFDLIYVEIRIAALAEAIFVGAIPPPRFPPDRDHALCDAERGA